MDRPLVSIVLTTYNSERVIHKVLDSILSQDFQLNKIELIVVDDGSKDNTVSIIKSFIEVNAHKFYDVRLIVHDKNYGVSRARNDGIRLARGNYILILDHDVILLKDTLNRLLEYLESSHIKISAVIPLHKDICSNFLRKWEYRIRKNRVTRGNAITSCALIKRDLISEAGFYDETLGPPFTIYEDIEYGARVLAKGYEIHIVGFIEVLHDACEESKGNITTLQYKYDLYAFMKKLITSLKSLSQSRYRYALKKYIRSLPLREKLRWIIYSGLILLTIPSLMLSLTIGSYLPLLMWAFLTILTYMDVLKYYWSVSVPHISLAYSAVAFAWRLLRSIMLIIPGPNTIQDIKSKE